MSSLIRFLVDPLLLMISNFLTTTELAAFGAMSFHKPYVVFSAVT